MKLEKEIGGAIKLAPQSLGAAARQDWPWWLGGALLSFVLASVLMSGWPAGLLPQLRVPFVYEGDGLSHAWMIKRVIDGWLYTNSHSGYPFGSHFYDYPGSDAGNLALVKLLGLASGSWAAVLNLYFLTCFAACFVCAYLVARTTGLNKPLAAAAALLYTFLPFHMQRIPHLFLTSYFVAPLFFYFALRIADGQLFEGPLGHRKGAKLAAAVTLAALASFGVYYALFGVMLFVMVAFAAICARGDLRPMKAAFAASCFVVVGVLLNVAPTVAYQKMYGKNPEVAQRGAADSELYGLKLMQLLVPQQYHRSDKLRASVAVYNAGTPLVNENVTASLGAVGAAGFLAMLGVAFAAVSGRKIERKLALLALAATLLFLFGTVGGLGSLFSHTVSASIRGWNRISVFIGFAALLGLFLLLQAALQRRLQGRGLLAASGVTAALLGVAGLWDQTSTTCEPCIVRYASLYDMDRDFAKAIEKEIPNGAVYQLPYMGFPEVPELHQLKAYNHMSGYLHSDTLNWSYGGMKGRRGDLFYRALASEPLERQLEVLRKLGFGGIYIDKRGYADRGAAVIAGFTALTGAEPKLSRADGQVVFFRLPGTPVDLGGKGVQEIMDLSGYGAERAAKDMEALRQGFQFNNPVFPAQLSAVRGVSGPEAWGRWTDGKLVEFEFAEPLRQRFTLVLRLRPFGPNSGKDMVLRVGSQEHLVTLLPGENEYRVQVDLGREQARLIMLQPPVPTSPRMLDKSADDRMLGVGLSVLRFEF